MAQPCTNEGFGDCSDCGPVSACCELDVSGVVVHWSGCGGALPDIRGWVVDPTSPTGFSSAAWTAPGRVFTRFTYEVTNTECDWVEHGEIMRRWEIAGWAKGTTRTFERNLAVDLRRCFGRDCTGGTTFPLWNDGAGPYNQDGVLIGSDDNGCLGPPVTGLGNRPPDAPTIIFDSPNSITVHHPCRVTADGADTLEHCTVKVTAQEYTAAIHKGIVDAELLATGYPPYSMLRTISHLTPGVVGSNVTALVAWPPDLMHCEQPSAFILGIDSTIAGTVLIRKSEPGLCNPSPGNSGPVENLEIIKRLGVGGNIVVADCFNCGERPSNILPPP
jgi:hypothetical protein